MSRTCEKGLGGRASIAKRVAGLRSARAVRRLVEGGSGALDVCEVRSDSELDQFVKVPWQIYADDPHWVPPLAAEVRAFLDRRRHPFYLHGESAQFLGLRNGVVRGRILVSDDPNYNRQHGTSVGSFGMFECADDEEMAYALLETAAAWLRARGLSAMMGPIDYSTNYTCGLLIDGFDTPPRGAMNHHRPYYCRLLESWGLEKIKDLHAWWFTDPHNLLDRWRGLAERIARRTGVVIRPARPDDLEADIRRCQSVCDATMHKLWGFVPLTEAELQHLIRRYVQFAVLDHILLAEIDGETVGFSVTLPDINEATGPLNGGSKRFGLPVDSLRLARRLKGIKTAQMTELALLEPYRRRGIAELLILRALDYGKNTLGYIGAELSWTLEDNRQVTATIEGVGARRYKTYRVYQKQLNVLP